MSIFNEFRIFIKIIKTFLQETPNNCFFQKFHVYKQNFHNIQILSGEDSVFQLSSKK